MEAGTDAGGQGLLPRPRFYYLLAVLFIGIVAPFSLPYRALRFSSGLILACIIVYARIAKAVKWW